MKQDKLNLAAERIAKILDTHHPHPSERSANIVMALQSCDSHAEACEAIESALGLVRNQNDDLIWDIINEWHRIGEVA